jgi:hypothetical protein
MNIDRRFYHETDQTPFQDPSFLFLGDGVGPVPHQRRRNPFRQEVMDMEGLTNFVSMLDYILDSQRKRHIVGGILLSASLLFGGLAMTVMSIKDEEGNSDEQDD